MEMIEVYKGDLSGLYIDIINQAIIEILFKDKNDELHTPIPDSFLDGIQKRK